MFGQFQFLLFHFGHFSLQGAVLPINLVVDFAVVEVQIIRNLLLAFRELAKSIILFLRCFSFEAGGCENRGARSF